MTGVMSALCGLPAFVATLDSDNEDGSDAGVITLGPVTCGVIGGIAPLTYLWSFASGGSGITFTASTTAATSFQSNPAGTGQTSGVAICTVTDARGISIVSGPCTLLFQGV